MLAFPQRTILDATMKRLHRSWLAAPALLLLGASAGAQTHPLAAISGRISDPTGAPLADAAFGSGYADQPHMTREFRELVGITPAAFRRGRGGAEPGAPAGP